MTDAKPKAQLFEIDPHPAIPPSDQLKQWEDLWHDEEEHADVLLIRAFQAGADQELVACCEWLEYELVEEGSDFRSELIAALRAARRPKPPSLAEQALDALDYSLEYDVSSKYELIRRALERLQKLEGGNG